MKILKEDRRSLGIHGSLGLSMIRSEARRGHPSSDMFRCRVIRIGYKMLQ